MVKTNNKTVVLTTAYLHILLAFIFEKCIAAQCYVLISVEQLFSFHIEILNYLLYSVLFISWLCFNKKLRDSIKCLFFFFF